MVSSRGGGVNENGRFGRGSDEMIICAGAALLFVVGLIFCWLRGTSMQSASIITGQNYDGLTHDSEMWDSQTGTKNSRKKLCRNAILKFL